MLPAESSPAVGVEPHFWLTWNGLCYGGVRLYRQSSTAQSSFEKKNLPIVKSVIYISIAYADVLIAFRYMVSLAQQLAFALKFTLVD